MEKCNPRLVGSVLPAIVRKLNFFSKFATHVVQVSCGKSEGTPIIGHLLSNHLILSKFITLPGGFWPT